LQVEKRHTGIANPKKDLERKVLFKSFFASSKLQVKMAKSKEGNTIKYPLGLLL